MFLRSLNNLHVLSNVGFYIDGISQESYLFIGVSPTQKRMMTDRLNTMNLPTKLKVGKGTYKSNWKICYYDSDDRGHFYRLYESP